MHASGCILRKVNGKQTAWSLTTAPTVLPPQRSACSAGQPDTGLEQGHAPPKPVSTAAAHVFHR